MNLEQDEEEEEEVKKNYFLSTIGTELVGQVL